VRALERSFAAACDRGDFRLVHYALQTTHAHLLVEATDADALARGMMAIGARLARALNRDVRPVGRVLAERFPRAHAASRLGKCGTQLAYVLLNARRHARHALDEVCEWIRHRPDAGSTDGGDSRSSTELART
jgi:hypothetical protein